MSTIPQNLKGEPRRTYWEPTRNPEKYLENHRGNIWESWGNHRRIVGEIGETLKETKVFCNFSSFVLEKISKTDFP